MIYFSLNVVMLIFTKAILHSLVVSITIGLQPLAGDAWTLFASRQPFDHLCDTNAREGLYREKSTVAAASCHFRRPLATEFICAAFLQCCTSQDISEVVKVVGNDYREP